MSVFGNVMFRFRYFFLYGKFLTQSRTEWQNNNFIFIACLRIKIVFLHTSECAASACPSNPTDIVGPKSYYFNVSHFLYKIKVAVLFRLQVYSTSTLLIENFRNWRAPGQSLSNTAMTMG